MAKITQEVHIYFVNGELTLYASFFYACTLVNFRKVIEMLDKSYLNIEYKRSELQKIIDILDMYYYFESITPAKKKQITKKRTEAFNWMEVFKQCEMTQ